MIFYFLFINGAKKASTTEHWTVQAISTSRQHKTLQCAVSSSTHDRVLDGMPFPCSGMGVGVGVNVSLASPPDCWMQWRRVHDFSKFSIFCELTRQHQLNWNDIYLKYFIDKMFWWSNTAQQNICNCWWQGAVNWEYSTSLVPGEGLAQAFKCDLRCVYDRVSRQQCTTVGRGCYGQALSEL